MASSRGRELDPDLDAQLVSRVLAGDVRGWEALVTRHERLVYAVARSYRLDEADRADVFQDVFTALVRGLPSMRDPRSLVRWLSSTTDRIARATALRRRREYALRGANPATPDELPSGEPAVGADLEILERQARVRLALSGLGERCRRLLEALYYRDAPASYAELARELGMPMNSVGPNRARCLDRMRDLLEVAAPDSRTKAVATRTSAPDGTQQRTEHVRRSGGPALARPRPFTRAEGRG